MWHEYRFASEDYWLRAECFWSWILRVDIRGGTVLDDGGGGGVRLSR